MCKYVVVVVMFLFRNIYAPHEIFLRVGMICFEIFLDIKSSRCNIVVREGAIYKLRLQKSGEEGLAKCQRYYISLCGKLINEEEGVKILKILPTWFMKGPKLTSKRTKKF